MRPTYSTISSAPQHFIAQLCESAHWQNAIASSVKVLGLRRSLDVQVLPPPPWLHPIAAMFLPSSVNASLHYLATSFHRTLRKISHLLQADRFCKSSAVPPPVSGLLPPLEPPFVAASFWFHLPFCSPQRHWQHACFHHFFAIELQWALFLESFWPSFRLFLPLPFPLLFQFSFTRPLPTPTSSPSPPTGDFTCDLYGQSACWCWVELQVAQRAARSEAPSHGWSQRHSWPWQHQLSITFGQPKLARPWARNGRWCGLPSWRSWLHSLNRRLCWSLWIAGTSGARCGVDSNPRLCQQQVIEQQKILQRGSHIQVVVHPESCDPEASLMRPIHHRFSDAIPGAKHQNWVWQLCTQFRSPSFLESQRCHNFLGRFCHWDGRQTPQGAETSPLSPLVEKYGALEKGLLLCVSSRAAWSRRLVTRWSNRSKPAESAALSGATIFNLKRESAWSQRAYFAVVASITLLHQLAACFERSSTKGRPLDYVHVQGEYIVFV